MNAHTLDVLEYDAIRERVVALATSALGRERARAMAPETEEALVRRRQRETTEAARLLERGDVPLGGIRDLRPALRIAAVGGVLDPASLLEVADTLAAARRVRTFLGAQAEAGKAPVAPAAPTLAELARGIGEFPLIDAAIREAIDEQAELRDEASPLLARLRREIRTLRSRMLERLHAILRSPAYRDMIQDPVVTTRDGRYCIPVKAEARSQFGGLVHDQSASGATLFMEPTAVVELGNELRQVEIRERQETERILRELTALVGRQAEELAATLELLGELDFIVARGRLAREMEAVEPRLNGEGFVGLRRARHPLLAPPVVPIDIELGRDFCVLVITGPNTGGKTVALKTVGLLALMAQSGLHIPADAGSTLPVFEGVYADIGDEQSLQQSLSTFSGHMRNIAAILRDAERHGSRALVLLDEAGAGTDPAEGAALAKAILARLLDLGARTIASTHYGELKEFAYTTRGVRNASVEFDVETLRPTYRLRIGLPGSSNAFTIAARLGLPEEVVAAARGMIGTDRALLSDVLHRLTEEQRATEADQRRAAEAAREAEAKREALEKELRRLREERAQTLARARAEAEELLRAARRETERLREELRRLERQAQRAAEESDAERLRRLRERLQKTAARADQRQERVERKAARARAAEAELAPPALAADGRPPAVGDLVWVSALGQRGTVLALEGERAQVQVGAMHLALPLEELQRLQALPGPAAPSGVAAAARVADLRLRARASVAPEVSLLGLRADEARMRLEEYVDAACLAGLSPLRIVHGKGTGALKRVVWECLREHPHVAAFRHPGEEEGGAGVTVVELKE